MLNNKNLDNLLAAADPLRGQRPPAETTNDESVSFTSAAAQHAQDQLKAHIMNQPVSAAPARPRSRRLLMGGLLGVTLLGGAGIATAAAVGLFDGRAAESTLLCVWSLDGTADAPRSTNDPKADCQQFSPRLRDKELVVIGQKTQVVVIAKDLVGAPDANGYFTFPPGKVLSGQWKVLSNAEAAPDAARLEFGAVLADEINGPQSACTSFSDTKKFVTDQAARFGLSDIKHGKVWFGSKDNTCWHAMWDNSARKVHYSHFEYWDPVTHRDQMAPELQYRYDFLAALNTAMTTQCLTAQSAHTAVKSAITRSKIAPDSVEVTTNTSLVNDCATFTAPSAGSNYVQIWAPKTP